MDDQEWLEMLRNVTPQELENMQNAKSFDEIMAEEEAKYKRKIHDLNVQVGDRVLIVKPDDEGEEEDHFNALVGYEAIVLQLIADNYNHHYHLHFLMIKRGKS